MNSRNERQGAWLVLAVGVVVSALTLSTAAQVQTDTITTSGQPTTEVKVDRGTVVLVDGNDLVVKAEDGHLRHFANVPESARAIVDGQELGIHDLKPGDDAGADNHDHDDSTNYYHRKACHGHGVVC